MREDTSRARYIHKPRSRTTGHGWELPTIGRSPAGRPVGCTGLLGGTGSRLHPSRSTKFAAPSTRLLGGAPIDLRDRRLDLDVKFHRRAEAVRLLEERVVISRVKRANEEHGLVIRKLYVHRVDHGEQLASPPGAKHRP